MHSTSFLRCPSHQVNTKMVHDVTFFTYTTGSVYKNGSAVDLSVDWHDTPSNGNLVQVRRGDECAPTVRARNKLLASPPYEGHVPSCHSLSTHDRFVCLSPPQGLNCGKCSRLYMSGGKSPNSAYKAGGWGKAVGGSLFLGGRRVEHREPELRTANAGSMVSKEVDYCLLPGMFR